MASIDITHENSALGTKLTRAGGGGSVFALVSHGQEESRMEVWQEAAHQMNVDTAQVYQAQVVHNGLETKRR